MDPKFGDKSQPLLEDETRQVGEEMPVVEKEAQSSALSYILRECHLFSLAVRIEEPMMDTRHEQLNQEPLSRRFFARLLPWHDFPDMQEQIWEKINAEPTFASQPLLALQHQVSSASRLIGPIDCHTALAKFEQLTVGDFVENIVDEICKNEPLRKQFFPSGKTSLQRESNTTARGRIIDIDWTIRETCSTPGSKDQFFMQAVRGEERRPLYVIEFKPPYELTLAELACGLEEIQIARDVTQGDEKNLFEYHSERLVAVILVHLYDYMINTGVRYGYLYTGEAYVFLRIMNDDPSVLQYFLSVPSIDVNEEELQHPHRTAVAQVLTFTLNALISDLPSQDWYNTIAKRPKADVEYLNALKTVPNSIRKDPPFYEHKPSPWKYSSGSSLGSPLYRKSNSQPPEEYSIHSESFQASNERGAPRQYCTMKCIHGLANGSPLDPNCPNVFEHGAGEHPLTAPQFTDQLREQLGQDREKDVEQLHIYGASGFLLKASLSNFGYTVLIKATSAYFSPRIEHEHKMYKYLRPIQGKHIPVCLGFFAPKTPYFYHGRVMTHMLILSCAGERIQRPQTEPEEMLLREKRNELMSILHSHGVEHLDKAWRNILWNREIDALVAIDLESVWRLSS